jgi:voltage-gated potassium channel Kch
MRAKKTIMPIDMEIISRAHKSVWTALKHKKTVVNSDETRELSDKVTRMLVEFAREGVMDLETLQERTLAEITRW